MLARSGNWQFAIQRFSRIEVDGRNIMAEIIVTDRAGKERTIIVMPGKSLMEELRDAGFDDILALCGGCRSCATCHVYVEPAYFEKLSEMSEDEKDVLETSTVRNEYSRLSCQVAITEAVDGMRVTIADSD
jgi:2Fe-2S ferredoxin